MAAAQMAMRWGLHGPQITLCQACATGIDVVGTAADLVRRGKVDVAIAGAYDATTGFDHPFIDDDFVPALRAAQTTYGMAADPETSIPSKPFDKNRTGSVSSEGAAFVIVESEEHAAARGRAPLAVVEGYASLGDGYHPSSPEPTGRWEQEVMRQALRDGDLVLDDIDAVIAHGTSTRKGDEAEINALNALFGERHVPLPVTSIKAHTGHLSAPSGTLAIVAAVLAMKEGSLVHTVGTKDVEDAVRFDVVIEKPRPLELNRIMVNGFGFGGQDASIVIGRPAS
jgi:3-oxoacyl-[acyl-carrier-protein] synthase II